MGCFLIYFFIHSYLQENTKGKVVVEELFNGRYLGVRDKSKVAYKTDFRLVHKHEEHKCIEAFKNAETPEVKIFPQTMEMPPLLKVNMSCF